MSYFWCLDHKKVEEDFGCGSTTRIGPYESAAEASTALQRTRKRAAEQNAKDAQESERGWGKPQPR